MPSLAVIDPSGMYSALYTGLDRSWWHVAESWSDIEFDLVSNQIASVKILGRPIGSYEAIIYTGAPSSDHPPSSPTETFVRTERSRALATALSLSRTKVINAGWHLSDNWTVQSPEYQILALAQLGWSVPSIRYDFTLAGRSHKTLTPQPKRKFFLVIDARSFYLASYVLAGSGAIPDRLVKQTRNYMMKLGLDWVCLVLAADELGAVYVYGLTVAVPAELGSESMSELLGGVLGT
jgi:hypothetical protein